MFRTLHSFKAQQHKGDLQCQLVHGGTWCSPTVGYNTETTAERSFSAVQSPHVAACQPYKKLKLDPAAQYNHDFSTILEPSQTTVNFQHKFKVLVWIDQLGCGAEVQSRSGASEFMRILSNSSTATVHTAQMAWLDSIGRGGRWWVDQWLPWSNHASPTLAKWTVPITSNSYTWL